MSTARHSNGNGSTNGNGQLVRFIPSSASATSRRALFVTNMWPDEKRPWYGSFIKTQADSLERIGVGVDVLYIRGYESKRAYLDSLIEPTRILRSRAYDVVHGHYGHSAAIARLQLRAPLVVSYCGDDLLGTPADESGALTRKTRIEAQVFRRLAHVADATITKSEEMERRLPSSCMPRNHVVPNGVDLAAFHPVDAGEARRKLGWPSDEVTVLFVGNPELPRKNYATAEKAARIAAREIPDLRLRVAWAIAPEDIPLWMSAANALLFPSKWEGSPNSVKEAMAAQLPIVATPVGDIPERLRGLPGCFVRPDDPEALGAALVDSIRHGRVPEAREAVSALSLENVARRVNSIYDTVMAGGRGSR